MTSLADIRKRRLEADVRELEKLRCSAIDWRVEGVPPAVVHLTYNIRTIMGHNNLNQLDYAYEHEIEVSIPPRYPLEPPVATMKPNTRVPFHPNFFASGLICTQNSKWTMDQSLATFCLQIAKMLQFDREVTDPNNAANGEARNWYISNLSTGLFPSDNQLLPVLGTDDDFRLNLDFEVLDIY